ncbi:MAG: glucose-1-phosphate thymidylyltransferase [Candidatus Levyibacteriota bacterium]
MKAIIPTGGRGTRMQPITFSANKHFIPVANKPLIFYPIETVVDAGIKDILITYNSGNLNLVKSYLGDGSRWGANFTYVLQEEPKGMANIFQVCEEALGGESFLLHNGDNIFIEGIKKALNHFLKKKPNGLITMVHHKDNRRLGVPYFDKNKRLLEYVEKPENPPHDFAIPGIYFFDSNVFKCFKGEDKIVPSARGELEIGAPFNWLIQHGYKVDVIEYEGKWMDPGKFDDWLDANKYLLDISKDSNIGSKLDSETEIEGKVSIGKDCRIINSKLKGPLVIGDGVEIINSHVGPYCSISNNSFMENSHLENSVLMEGVKIINVKRPIAMSLIGPGSEIIDSDEDSEAISFFIGEKSKIDL